MPHPACPNPPVLLAHLSYSTDSARLAHWPRWAQLAAAVALTAGFSAAVQAANHGVRSSAKIQAPPVIDFEDTGWLANPLGVPAKAHAEVSFADVGTRRYEGRIDVETSYGELAAKGYGSTTNDVNFGAFQWHVPGTNNGGEPNGWFVDRLTVQSSVLPAGTWVTVQVGVNFLGSYGLEFNSLYPRPQFNYVDVSGGLIVKPVHPTKSWLTVGMSSTRSLDTQQQGSFQARVGSSFDIAGWLWVNASADANYLGLKSTSSFEYDARMWTSFSGGPDVEFISSSGKNYIPTPIPEPQTYALMAMGLAVLAGLRMRRDKRPV